MICNKCGKTIVDDAVFCSYCGAKQELSCEECGTKLPQDARFCHKCGAPTEKQIKNGLDWEALTMEAAKAFDKPIDWSNVKLDEDALLEDAPTAKPACGSFYAETEEAPNVPTVEKVKNKEFSIVGENHCVKEWNRTLEVQTRFNDDYAKDTDPMHFLFSEITFYEGNYPERKQIQELTNISAYALAENGIYFADPIHEVIKFWDAETGSLIKVGTGMKDVLFMSYDGGFVYVETFDKLVQTASSEHRDECGYMFEAWYDIYDIHTTKHTFLAEK